ncbi:hypothetical protein AK830_g6747 [Neonectria ditissima]|uniref:Rhodopsin domain-containing protein n=1 Tax=Neonectria ditissima TaxID=78410 RepID=A0A0P7BBR7_9HYPO|nr:hypothetical protein AK830_g6747 [Neonectria ditissima]
MDDNYLKESKQTQLSLVAWIFTGMAIITVLTKLYTTLILFRRPGWDDVVIFLSLLFSIIASSLVQVSTDLGLGLHTAAVQAEQGGLEKMVETKRIQILGYPFNILAYSLPNVAILILIERLAGQTDTIPRRTLRAIVSIQLILATVSVIIIFIQCQPTKYLWDQSTEGSCWSSDVFNYSSYVVSVFTAFTDLVLAVIPIHAFWKLQLKLHEKLEISFMLGLTLLSALFTIVKATYLHLFTDRVDPLVWGLVEQNIVIMAASIPTLRPLLHHIKEKGAIRTTTSYFHTENSPKRTDSISEAPLDDISRQVAQRSRQSFEAQNSSDDWNHRSGSQAKLCMSK